MKFGGTSVRDASSILKIAEIYKSYNGKAVIVVSAPAGITNKLQQVVDLLKSGMKKEAISKTEEIYLVFSDIISGLAVQKECVAFLSDTIKELNSIIKAIDIIGEVTPKSTAYILSRGEYLSSFIISKGLSAQGIECVHTDSRDVIKTDSNFMEAEVIDDLTASRVDSVVTTTLENYDLVVCGGFIGSNEKRETTILGRGGSDYTAAIIASSLKSDMLEIWTDVDGILTCDPKYVKSARLIKALSYKEAAELSYFGAKVLHPKTIRPAVDKGVPVIVKNTFKPNNPGTEILAEPPFGYKSIKSVSFRTGVTVINIESNRMLGAFGFLAKVFEIFKKYETSVDLVTTSEVSISLTIDKTAQLDAISAELREFSNVEIYDKKAIISAIGESIRDTIGISSKFFGALSGINISMISLGASEVNLSIIVSEDDLEAALNALHDEFFSGELNENVFQKLK